MKQHDEAAERRKTQRYPLEAPVKLRRKNGEAIPARSMNLSSSGLRLCMQAEPCPLAVDEEITLEVELPEGPERGFSAWGVGRVVYVDGATVGIQLYGGQFELPSEGEPV